MYKIIFAIRDYEGFDFVVDSFDLMSAFQEIGFDSELYYERFPEFNKANQHVMPFGPNSFRTTYWDYDHKDNDDI